ncbi:MAG: metallophosphatase family protein [Chloroflexi bacterium]|nr:metallophosphatase family protein [Chloroflexota bacterium]
MRILVISDIHSNLAALEAVLADAPAYDQIWSLGDIVGYAAQPNECIELLASHAHVYIAGNHDWGVLGNIDLDDFNPDARKAALWAREQLTPAARMYLEQAPETIVEGEVTLAHGSPRSPVWEYIMRANTAQQNLTHFQTSLCLVGHTHLPAIFWQPAEGMPCVALRPQEGQPFSYAEGRSIVNPGSVGQPRDYDPRAAYALLDSDARTIEHRRVAYDIRAAQRKMRAAGLPQHIVIRLQYGQ